MPGIRQECTTQAAPHSSLIAECGFEDCEASVRRTVAELRCNIHDIFVPLSYEPAEAVQVDWGEATIILGGCKQKLQIWCMRECFSGAIFVTAFYRQNEEVDYAIRLKAIAESPCKNAAIPKIPHKEATMFTVEQAHTFLDILDKEETPVKFNAFFQLALFGGFRRGEILGLEWNDIDFEHNIVHIRRTVHYSKELGYYDTEPKSKNSVRALTLPENVLYTLRQLQNEQLSQRLKLGDKWHNTSKLFTTWDGHQMHGATPFTWLTKICKQYDLPKVNLHSFRHLNASLLISQGVDVKTVQSVLGHSQASTTLNIYAAAFREREAQALGAVADVLNTPKSKAK